VAEKNLTFRITDTKGLEHKEIDAVISEDWAKCGAHCVKIQGGELH